MNPATPENIARPLVDSLCRAFNQRKAEAEAAETALGNAKALLIEAVQRYGYVPTNAEKSIRLEGDESIATVTTGTTVEIVDAYVIELQLALSRAKMPRLFRQLFDRRVKYSLRKGAAKALQFAVGKLPEVTRKQLSQLFSLCFGVSTRSPSLTVEASAAVEAREAKAAKKAAKKAGRK
jgi:hypothetical protein